MNSKEKSGASKRKKAKEIKERISKLPKIDHYFALGTATATESVIAKEPTPNTAAATESATAIETVTATKSDISDDLSIPGVYTDEEKLEKFIDIDFIQLSNDPGDWPKIISDKQRLDIVKRGPPIQDESYNFPSNNCKRRFTSGYYYHTSENGERVKRSWLMYSISRDAIFCFCCMLFSYDEIPLRRGTSTWEGLTKKLQQHETGSSHKECLAKWFDLRNGILNRSTINDDEVRIFFKERDFWRDVLEWLIDIILFLSERNLAFRGSIDKLGSKSNGNFLGFVELISKRDPILGKLVDRIKHKTTHIHYLSPDIQNELIKLIADNIREKNVLALKKAKYYSIILDCTPDTSHKEQMSVVMRFVECHDGLGIKIREVFMGFLNVCDATGEGLLNSFLELAQELNIDICNMRGQAYDHGSNMSGKNKGVQARLLEMNPRALYVPCGSHTWNLVITDAAKSSVHAIDFFGNINRIYTIFASSPFRWNIIEECMPLKIKGLSDTRWESRIDAVKPFRFHLQEICEALEKLRIFALGKKDGVTASEADSLLEKITKWPFLITTCIWYDILFTINNTSKFIQSPNITVDVLQSEISATLKYFEDYRNTGYNSAIVNASEIADEIQINKVFPEKRRIKTKILFQYESKDEVVLSEEEKFKSNFFLIVIDQIISSITSRFNQLLEWNSIFGFLTNSKNLNKCADENMLKEPCKIYAERMQDVDSEELEAELNRFINVIHFQKNLLTAKDFLTYIYANSLQEIYANTAIVLRILLSTPVTVASAERSFSRLGIIKNILRSTMSNERLSALGIISLENEVAKSLDFNELANKFAAKKTRRKKFSR